MEREPEPLQTTPPLDRVIRTCLAKDPDQRFQNAGDLKRDLIWAMETTAVGPAATAAARPVWLVVAATALALITAASLSFAIWKRPVAVPKTAVRFTIPLPPGQEITSYPAITRDGRTVAYVTQQGTNDSQLYLRDLNSFESRVVAGASGAMQPFFSPDGWHSSLRGSFKKRRSPEALPSGWPKPPRPSVERGTRTTSSSTAGRLVPDYRGSPPAAEPPNL